MLRTRHWILKAAIQKALSLLPESQMWNRLLQQYITRALEMDPVTFEHKLTKCRKHLENYFSIAGGSRPGFSVMELGTGWYPIVPIGLYLCGASPVWTVDIQPLLSRERVRKVLALFCHYAERGRLADILPWVNKDRVAHLLGLAKHAGLRSVGEVLGLMQIHPIVADARRPGLPSGSIDLFVSNGTLLVIPKDVLWGIFTEFRRLASAGAVMSHQVYMGDVYACFDSSITAYNFMKFSSSKWKLFNNSLLYQNRLRISEYRRLHESAGWTIKAEENVQGSLDDFRKVQLAKDFQGYSQEDLLTLWSWLTSQCKPATTAQPNNCARTSVDRV